VGVTPAGVRIPTFPPDTNGSRRWYFLFFVDIMGIGVY
jgi:hypothetical protein